MTEALKSTTIFKDGPEEKECDSTTVFCEVCHNNNCQPENLSFQSGVFAEVGSSSGSNNNNCQPENSSFQFRVFAEVGSNSSNNNNCRPEISSFQSGCLSPRNGEECATVHMLQATRLPGRHEKLVKLQFDRQDIALASRT